MYFLSIVYPTPQSKRYDPIYYLNVLFIYEFNIFGYLPIATYMSGETFICAKPTNYST
jgi:hypothetical protein